MIEEYSASGQISASIVEKASQLVFRARGFDGRKPDCGMSVVAANTPFNPSHPVYTYQRDGTTVEISISH
jgi:hypothetical protein